MGCIKKKMDLYRETIPPFSSLDLLLVLRQNALLRLRRNKDKINGGFLLQ